jgi:predicted Holliday junction resolvase-like endonuclease
MQMVTAAHHVIVLLRLQLMQQQKKLLKNQQEILLTLQRQSKARKVARQQPDHFSFTSYTDFTALTRRFQHMISMASP